jgi:DNA-binding response OmpR family regulator
VTRARRAAVEGHSVCESILVVEADPNLGRLLLEQLTADRYRVVLAHTAEHARVLAGNHAPRLAVLGDLGSPRGALELLEEIRQPDHARTPWQRDMPVMMVGGRAAELDVLRAFEAGADEFLARRTRYLELRARLRALLRRTGTAGADARLLRVGPLSIEPCAHHVSLHGQSVELCRLEFELLTRLASEPSRVFDKDELLRSVWGYRSNGVTRTVDSHASRLRRKLELDDGRRWVINVWGVGYRLI